MYASNYSITTTISSLYNLISLLEPSIVLWPMQTNFYKTASNFPQVILYDLRSHEVSRWKGISVELMQDEPKARER